MSTLNLKNPNGPEEVILETFDEDNTLTVLTVVDSEGNPATVTLDDNELEQIRGWIAEKLL